MASTKKQDKADTVTPSAPEALQHQLEDSQSKDRPAEQVSPLDPEQAPAIVTVNADSGLEQMRPLLVEQPTATEISASHADATEVTQSRIDEQRQAASGDQIKAESTTIPRTDPNPISVEVYPMRTYMDEGELRRRGGPSYQVPRRHAEDLERRNLVSRTPLEE